MIGISGLTYIEPGRNSFILDSEQIEEAILRLLLFYILV